MELFDFFLGVFWFLAGWLADWLVVRRGLLLVGDVDVV